MAATCTVTASGHTLDSFAVELRAQLADAWGELDAAQRSEDPLLVMVAEGRLADLQALAVRNDISLDA